MLQRGNARIGARLGKSTGWIHRAELSRRDVKAVAGCHYTRIDDEGLHYETNGASHVARAETVIICAGQESLDELSAALQAAELPCDVIGGARFAGELDALRAIDEGTRLAYSL
jgi:2,4-dienoyl-CoA reductase (NADPH2)